MNIQSGSKDRIDIKEEELKEELSKPEKEQNWFKINRLRESIKRNKDIAHLIKKRRRDMKGGGYNDRR